MPGTVTTPATVTTSAPTMMAASIMGSRSIKGNSPTIPSSSLRTTTAASPISLSLRLRPPTAT